MKKILYILVALLVIGIVSNASISEAGMNIYVRIPNIRGESMDANHPGGDGWIEVDGFNYQIEQLKTGSISGSTRTGSNSKFSAFVVNKRLDSTSPVLSHMCAKGIVIPEVVVELTSTITDKRFTFMRYIFKNVMLTTVETGGSSQDSGQESVAFNFDEIEWIYTLTDPKTGASRGNVTARYNIVEQR